METELLSKTLVLNQKLMGLITQKDFIDPGWATLSPIATSGELAMKMWHLVRQKNCQISH
jgi:hypothetical protein